MKQWRVKEIEHQKRFVIYYGTEDGPADLDRDGWTFFRSEMMLADVERLVMFLNRQQNA